jgi:hypothetical protein
MAQLQEQKTEALTMKLRGEVDLQTYRAARDPEPPVLLG